MDFGLVLGVIALGIVHGVLPDHGWPIAAAHALSKPRKWLQGTIAALVIGIGHLVSSVALVLAYFWFSTFATFADGPWLKPLAGTLLILLGIYEYLNGRRGDGGSMLNHGDTSDHHEAAHDDPSHHHDTHSHFDEDAAEGGLRTLGITALVLGFAHEEPIQILAICAGTEFCLELMLVYSLAVILAILAPTLLLVAGYQTHQERIERYEPYLPILTAVVLIGVGLGFVLGIF